MSETKKCLKMLAIYYLLFAIRVLLNTNVISSRFPTDQIQTIYLLVLSVCLILRYFLKAVGRKKLKKTLINLGFMIFFMVLLRGIKYTVFGNTFILGRYTWYLYYVPTLMIPMFLFHISLYIFSKDESQNKIIIRATALITAILIIIVITNDFHQKVFRFDPGFINWDSEYSRGTIFTVVNAWEYLLYAAAVLILTVKCSVTKIIRWAWVVLVPFAIGIFMLILLVNDSMFQINGMNGIEFPDALCFMAAGGLECCMQLGIIPTNESYRKIMQATSLPVQITDYSGNVVYKSEKAKELTREQFLLMDNSRIEEHSVLKKISIPGGYEFWNIDVAELDRISGELSETKERLAEEGEFIRLKNELKEKNSEIEQRNRVYDNIARRTSEESMMISRIAKEAANTGSPQLKDKYRKEILVLASYIKRYANLMLLSSEGNTISAGELSLSVGEVLRYLNLYGIPGEIINLADDEIDSKKALSVFEVFGKMLEKNLSGMKGIYINLSDQTEGLAFKLILENMCSEKPEMIMANLADGINVQFEYEENVGYLSLLILKGGEIS